MISLRFKGAAQPAKWDRAGIAAAKARFRAETEAERPGIAGLCDALRAVLPEDAMVFSDMTQFAYVAREVWDMPAPGMWHHPTGFGTLGYGLPAAIGGAMARPGRPTLCIAGDYGFQYTVQELGTAVEMGLPIPILLWDNGKLKEIEDSMVASQIAPNAVKAVNPDFCKLAEAYGCLSEAPGDVASLQGALLKWAPLRIDNAMLPPQRHKTRDWMDWKPPSERGIPPIMWPVWSRWPIKS